ncbi:MAG TPA: hypothetical protein VK273_09775 [Gaiellaceae bacterium]|nr:hypothetical protein [Gaiellaceae bacterium]
MGNEKEWESLVKRHLDFLSDFGFRLDHVDEKWWATSAVYLSDLLGIEVTRSMEFGRVEITLLRLIEAKPPEVEVWLSEHPLDRVLFDNVLEARAPDQLRSLASGISDDEVQEQLCRYGELLVTVVPDFLEGGDAALGEGEAVIRKRAAANPQELTVWLPSDASEADEADARAKAERATPPEVRIVVRRYSRR